MAGVSTKHSPLAVRVLITLGALLSLCVSDSVGPRLLPLPAASERAAERRQAFDAADVSHAPARECPAVVRVAMAAPARKQAGAEQQPLHVAAHAAEGLISPAPDAGPFAQTTYSPIHATTATATRPPGRAPPPSV